MSSATRVQKHRDQLRKAGLRPIQLWVPDTRKAGFAEAYRRQSLLCTEADKHDNELMDFIESELDELEPYE